MVRPYLAAWLYGSGALSISDQSIQRDVKSFRRHSCKAASPIAAMKIVPRPNHDEIAVVEKFNAIRPQVRGKIAQSLDVRRPILRMRRISRGLSSFARHPAGPGRPEELPSLAGKVLPLRPTSRVDCWRSFCRSVRKTVHAMLPCRPMRHLPADRNMTRRMTEHSA